MVSSLVWLVLLGIVAAPLALAAKLGPSPPNDSHATDRLAWAILAGITMNLAMWAALFYVVYLVVVVAPVAAFVTAATVAAILGRSPMRAGLLSGPWFIVALCVPSLLHPQPGEGLDTFAGGFILVAVVASMAGGSLVRFVWWLRTSRHNSDRDGRRSD